jgi:hypothetical protein
LLAACDKIPTSIITKEGAIWITSWIHSTITLFSETVWAICHRSHYIFDRSPAVRSKSERHQQLGATERTLPAGRWW